MSSNAPPIVLTFGLSDPTGGSGLQADLLTLASMGCHGASVLTGYTIRDSASCDEVTGLDPDAVVAQARMLLEDMPVAAFKIGATARAEVVSAIAEVVADYDGVPLVLAPDFTLDDEHVLAADDLRESIADLLAPQTTLLVADHATLIALAQPDGDAEAPNLDAAIAHLLSQGCEYILATETGSHRLVNTLYGEEGQIRQDLWERTPHRLMGVTDTLGTAIAALLANGQEPPEAVREAQEYLYQAARDAFRPGMGAWVPDRFFWARSNDDAPAAPAAPATPPFGASRH
ncbi:bifunctional hydroxymethylpyrimidine kinase/phosphomethylpyrimidine kinase [Burkholderia glumae]|uniref:hydroxymethylpyrimidine kinase n=2 Tax=Burkholderia glumae TaxID=337 RepID=A0AAP9Y534_BURGL|nr:hydroxymethylpyrimidine/phosphomethylpyrimidine kinase [Burkholderia glumae]ACR27908.1 Hydroxymethylpyrimidine/phosphomethylpyrimidine kinase [Burkholderia glumae BGR1]AJY67438.1 phosphomethylpyrimidine kinase family protein [Burkholderia glumae LMG 2196 = ATCC 33617]KHJ62637.1 kinase [Burkholderia glumae]MCM2481114.1 hydroxymethylpyrimidine/phosphomethylpyrimidine kinase [Burkholderia glumae]MCM2492207.1 hydroxymethylpyrimidine/phosphomethylpyrimidine kinase [Burkholderia glumae]